MAHKLELAVNDVIKSVTQRTHFQAFTDSLCSHFSRSPKNQTQLKSAAAELHLQLLKIVRTFDIRWVSSSYRSVHAIWQSYPALVQHFEYCSTGTTRNTRERAKCSGMSKKLRTWRFVAELVTIHDALDVLRSLSLYLQKRQASVLTADAQISTAVVTLQGMKEGSGTTAGDFIKV